MTRYSVELLVECDEGGLGFVRDQLHSAALDLNLSVAAIRWRVVAEVLDSERIDGGVCHWAQWRGGADDCAGFVGEIGVGEDGADYCEVHGSLRLDEIEAWGDRYDPDRGVPDGPDDPEWGPDGYTDGFGIAYA